MNDSFKNTLQENGTLKNKLNITDPNRLQMTEYQQSARMAIQYLSTQPEIKSVDDLFKIHKIMFGKIYDWAGKPRTYDISKGDTDFQPHSTFDTATQYISSLLHNANKTNKPLPTKIYAELLDNINYMHPFREGNGRSTKLFLQALSANHADVIHYNRNDLQMIKYLNAPDVPGISSMMNIDKVESRQLAKLLAHH